MYTVVTSWAIIRELATEVKLHDFSPHNQSELAFGGKSNLQYNIFILH